jgi:hypothetical protein
LQIWLDLKDDQVEAPIESCIPAVVTLDT